MGWMRFQMRPQIIRRIRNARPAEFNSAIQQILNLRYCARWRVARSIIETEMTHQPSLRSYSSAGGSKLL